MKTKMLVAAILALFLLALMFPSPKAKSKEGCTRYFGWGSDPDGSAHCMSEEAALPSNTGGVAPQGPLNVTAGQPVTFAINWSEWHDGLTDWAIYIGTILGTISYPPYNVSYPRLVNTTLLASWRNEITYFGDPPTVMGPYVENASYVPIGTLSDYNPKILPNLDSTPFEAATAFVFVKTNVTITIPVSLAGTYTIRFISTSSHGQIFPPDSNDVCVFGNPLITLWGWSQQQDPNGYPWGEFVDITAVVAPAGTIYIRADGSIDPLTANITSADNITYFFTGNINGSIVVERSNIVIDGNGYALQGDGSRTGISISYKGIAAIKNMTIKGFGIGVHLTSGGTQVISGNNITDNGIGIRIEEYSNAGDIFSNIIANNSIYGIGIGEGCSARVFENDVVGNYDGIHFANASSSNIFGNSIAGNAAGIRAISYSGPLNISGNFITNNEFGLYLREFFSSNISENLVADNDFGVWLEESGYNRFYRNNFIDNVQQALLSGTLIRQNYWDDGYPIGGNYWSNYSGTDMYSGPYQDIPGPDGFGDIPHVIFEENQDNFPFMEPIELALGDIFPPYIESVSRTPLVPNYDEAVEVEAVVYDNVEVDHCLLFYRSETEWTSVTMTRNGDNFTASIPVFFYNTLLEYRVNAKDINGVWAVSEVYSYSVEDFFAPETNASQTPTHPSSISTVRVYANVTEPVNASGVKIVLFSYRVNGGPWWNTTMVFNQTLGLYESLMPPIQQTGDFVEYFVEARDNAGNSVTRTSNYTIGLPGDTNGDKKVDGKDIALLAKYFGSTSGFPPDADVNQDGKVDGKDIAIAAENFGKTWV